MPSSEAIEARSEPRQIFYADVRWEFESASERAKFMDSLQHGEPLFLSRSYTHKWSHCRACLRPNWRANLDSEGYCKPAYMRGCQREQERISNAD